MDYSPPSFFSLGHWVTQPWLLKVWLLSPWHHLIAQPANLTRCYAVVNPQDLPHM